jgi:hypothetical protein
VSQECLERLEDKDHLEPLECQVLRVLMDQEVHPAAEDHLVDRECLD